MATPVGGVPDTGADASSGICCHAEPVHVATRTIRDGTPFSVTSVIQATYGVVLIMASEGADWLLAVDSGPPTAFQSCLAVSSRATRSVPSTSRATHASPPRKASEGWVASR